MAGIKDFILGFVGYTLVFVIVGIVLRLVFFKEFPLTETNEVLGSLFLACFIVLIGPVGATVAHAARKGRPFIAVGILSAFIIPYALLLLYAVFIALVLGGFHGPPLLFYLAILIALIIAIFWLWMLIHSVKRNFESRREKLFWILFIFLTGIIGALVYFLLRKEIGRGTKE